MDSKTARVVDKALIRLEKEIERARFVVADVRASISASVAKHYQKPKKEK